MTIHRDINNYAINTIITETTMPTTPTTLVTTQTNTTTTNTLETKTRRILFLSLKFNYSPFSGNGVLARSLVTSLVHRNYGHDDSDTITISNNKNSSNISIRVMCTRPHSNTPGIFNDICMTNNDVVDTTTSATNTTTNKNNNNDDMEIWSEDLPRECQWKRLDRSGPWHEYADADAVCSGSVNIGGGSDIGDGTLGCCYASRVKEFMPTDVIAVDWHDMLAWEAIHSTLSQDAMMVPGKGEDELLWQPFNANFCYYNFRVYSCPCGITLLRLANNNNNLQTMRQL